MLQGRISGAGEPECTNGIVVAGLSLRQARFLVTVMLHSGVFVGRQYAAFAGITHGQKVHDFIEKLLARRFITAIEARVDRTEEDLPRPPQAALRGHWRAGQPEPPSDHARQGD